MRWISRVGSISALAVTASLLLARVHPFGDAGLYAAKAPIPASTSIPENVRTLLTAKCADCHSERPKAPIYGRFAPISWLLERDILQARAAMNLSQWDTYSADQQETYKAKIVQQTKSGEMPLLQYRIIHWKARITQADVQALTQWIHTVIGVADAAASVGGEGDPIHGKEIFEKRCTGCHALTQNREGPQLLGVYGRTAGAVAGFPYSAALKKANIKWTDQTLEKWLTDPDVFLPGNNMDFLVARPKERKDLIAYFKKSAGA